MELGLISPTHILALSCLCNILINYSLLSKIILLFTYNFSLTQKASEKINLFLQIFTRSPKNINFNCLNLATLKGGNKISNISDGYSQREKMSKRQYKRRQRRLICKKWWRQKAWSIASRLSQKTCSCRGRILSDFSLMLMEQSSSQK